MTMDLITQQETTMRLQTYENALRRAYNKNETLQRQLPIELTMAMIDTYRQYQRGLRASIVVGVVAKEITKGQWSYESIQFALSNLEAGDNCDE